MDEERFGPYQLLEPLGQGGMGEVWRAFDTRRRRVVALKRLPPHLAADTQYQIRFRRESAIAARINEAHIVPVHDYREIDGRLFLDMRLVEGTDLASLIAAEGPLPVAQAVELITQIAGALDAAHREGLVHRDVKPSNILLADGPAGPFAYLIDFGIAGQSAGTALTATGTLVGTLAYMAPERFDADREPDGRVDVYGLACVLHEALTGAPPFARHQDGPRLMYAHLHEPPPRPAAQRPGLPAGFDGVVARGMAKDPDRRFARATDLAAAARDAVTDGPAATRWHLAPVTGPGPSGMTTVDIGPRRWSRRRVLGLAAGAAVLGAAGYSGYAVLGPRDPVASPVNTLVGEVPVAAASAVAPLPDGQRLYVTSGSNGAVAVVEPGTATVSSTVAVGGSPLFVVVAPDGRRAYVTDFRDGRITVLDTAADAVVAQIAEPGAYTAAVAPDGSLVYVCHSASSAIAVLDSARNEVVDSFDLFGDQSLHDIALSPDGATAYVTVPTENAMAVVDLASRTVTATLRVPGVPYAVALSPDGRRAYLTDNGAGTLTLLDLETGTVPGLVRVGANPTIAAVSPDGTRVLVSNTTAASVSIVDTAGGTVVATVPVGPNPYGLAVGPDGSRAYVATGTSLGVIALT